MSAPRALSSLVVELAREERAAYERTIRESYRVDADVPVPALRAVAAHANETLDELAKIAKARGVSTRSLRALAADVGCAARRGARHRWMDPDESVADAVNEMEDGIDLVRRLQVTAVEEGDLVLAAWCHRWLSVREALVVELWRELQ